MRNKPYAVLTGDLVKSSRMSPAQSTSAMECLRQLAKEFESVYPDSTIGQLDTFRHDSWQWLLAKPELALRAAVFMRTGLRSLSDRNVKFDTRVAIGTGTVETETIVEHRISDSRGSAFTRSGKALDAMKKYSRLAYAAESDIAAERWLAGGLVPLLDCVVTVWTPIEARAVHGALRGWTQEETAERWPILSKTGERRTRQAVRDSLRRAHWNTVQEALEFAEEKIKASYEAYYEK
ncbi:MAG: hypothetical protein GX937_13865 [Lentisphaerae bacterium]|jgi:hypothetical protein|nr:hypothetical protein [Lentisphaerota bacterium]